ncbi:MAG: dihydroorotate dehydrogenase electron transfer subunit [Peptoniphilaceae bacterium]|nr:dihydroorotate dehydrogenase electron transfer subunit [Peptoniphilaceae bacterium]MDY6018047.1 dihydroorotate dehydrogenase electron transfer subunit [Anaerococcus sp.]
MKSYKIGKILENKEIAKDIWQMKVKAKLESQPGQFFMLRAASFRNDPLLSRPFGVCDENKDQITFLYQVVGKATKIMASLRENEEVKLLGPLGKGFDLKKDKKIALVAGGLGIAPLLYLCKSLENKPDFYAGFSDEIYFVDAFSPFVNKIVTTVDKIDHKFITEVIDTDNYDLIYACGPNPMLKALCDKNTSAEIQVSMEAHMACGIGACLGCTIEAKDGGFLRVCKDGPVFYAKEVF